MPEEVLGGDCWLWDRGALKRVISWSRWVTATTVFFREEPER